MCAYPVQCNLLSGPGPLQKTLSGHDWTSEACITRHHESARLLLLSRGRETRCMR